MKFNLTFCCLVAVCWGCEEETPLPCQLSQTGWVCPDTGTDTIDSTQDAGRDVKSQDLATIDLSTDLPSDTSEDLPPTIDMVVLPPQSCLDVNARNLPTGNHEIEIEGQMRTVYCDSDVDGGGWMLIARSVPDGTGDFGWNGQSGSLDDDSAVFSFGTNPIPFSEVLATNYTNGKIPGDRQYILTMPDNFMTACAAASCDTTVRSPTNSCANNVNGNEVFMLDHVGWISGNNFFWFREIVENAGTGFRPTGWSLFFDDCRAGDLNGQPGLLFVR